jgi:hypothetical protein
MGMTRVMGQDAFETQKTAHAVVKTRMGSSYMVALLAGETLKRSCVTGPLQSLHSLYRIVVNPRLWFLTVSTRRSRGDIFVVYHGIDCTAPGSHFPTRPLEVSLSIF